MDAYYIATVVNNAPTKEDQKERVGVWIEIKPVWEPSVKNTVWARVLQPFASTAAGVVYVPEKDDEVVVLGGMATGAEPVVIGGLYTQARKPPTLQGKKDEVVATVRGIVTPGGMEITIDDTADAEVILLRARGDADGTVDKDTVSIQLAKKDGVLTVVAGEATVDVKKKAVTVTVDEGDVTVTTKKGKVTVDAKGDALVKSGGNVTVEGQKVVISASSVEIAS